MRTFTKVIAALMLIVSVILVTGCKKTDDPNNEGNGNGEVVSLWPNGMLPGHFSVSATQQVRFSQGNLQYQASANTWRFAGNQYDICDVGEDRQYYIMNGEEGFINVSLEQYNAYIQQGDPMYYKYYYGYNVSTQYTSSSTSWIDLFGFGTSGYDHGAVCYQPWSTSENNYDYWAYGDISASLSDQTGQADWGYNAITNGGNTENSWRTLTYSEWDYVLNTRTTNSGIRYAMANVNNVNGVILLPDEWTISTYNLSDPNTIDAYYSSNILTASQWSVLEQAGAVFLPAAGLREGTLVCYRGDIGAYWATLYDNGNYAACLEFFNETLGLGGENGLELSPMGRRIGLSVRLVCDAE